ncbi:MAG: TetR/AcrR family transcriptional regulator [Stenotrophomonas sp.]|uniref:TetR/AcrR family transcriptional regulator n=1 Tax=Stenotrophomonas sp. TaxID=69392 RepID=UPI003D6CC4D0
MTSIRPDAALRRAQLLDAADAVFGEHGITAPLDLVVERAAVGRATLYRNFPDRASLIGALLERTVAQLQSHLLELGNREDAFFEVIDAMAARIVHSPAMADYWRAVDQDSPPVRDARQRVLQLIEPALLRAKAAGLCRADLQLSDVTLISSMLGAALRGRTREERSVLATRALELLRPGLSPQRARAVP